MPTLAELHSRGTVPLQHFFCFSNLPIELRLKIWRCTFPGPQVIEIEPDHCIPDIDGWMTPSFYYHRYRGTINPIALQINQESRAEALRFYELCPHSFQYINYSTDTIFLLGIDYPENRNTEILQIEVLKELFTGGLHKIQYLVYSHEYFKFWCDFFGWSGKWSFDITDITDLTDLKDIGIVLMDDEELPAEKLGGKRRADRTRALVDSPPFPGGVDSSQLPVLILGTPEWKYREVYKDVEAFKEYTLDLWREEGNHNPPTIHFLETEGKPAASCLPPPTLCLGCFGEEVEKYEAYEALGESAWNEEEVGEVGDPEPE